MKTIKQQIDDGKREINFHLNIETIEEASTTLGITLSQNPKDFLRCLLKEEVNIIAKRTEGLASIIASKHITKEQLKNILKAMSREDISKFLE